MLNIVGYMQQLKALVYELLLQHNSFGGCCMLRKGEKRIMRISYSTLLLSLLASWHIWHAHETSSIFNFIIFLTFERN